MIAFLATGRENLINEFIYLLIRFLNRVYFAPSVYYVTFARWYLHLIIRVKVRWTISESCVEWVLLSREELLYRFHAGDLEYFRFLNHDLINQLLPKSIWTQDQRPIWHLKFLFLFYA